MTNRTAVNATLKHGWHSPVFVLICCEGGFCFDFGFSLSAPLNECFRTSEHFKVQNPKLNRFRVRSDCKYTHDVPHVKCLQLPSYQHSYLGSL